MRVTYAVEHFPVRRSGQSRRGYFHRHEPDFRPDRAMASLRASRHRGFRRSPNRNDPAKLEDLPGWNPNDYYFPSDHDCHRSCHQNWNPGYAFGRERAGPKARLRCVAGNNPPDCLRFVRDQTRERCLPRCRSLSYRSLSYRSRGFRIPHCRCPNRPVRPRYRDRIRDPIHERYRPLSRGSRPYRAHWC